MKIKIDQKIFARLGDTYTPYFAVVEGLNCSAELAKEIAVEFEEFQNELRAKYQAEEYLASPVFAAWEQAFAELDLADSGVSVSLVNMLGRIVDSGKNLASVHPLVDVYNMFVLKTFIPMGAYDLDRVEGDVELVFAFGKEKFKQLGKNKVEVVPENEVILHDANEAMCRYWVWKQSETTKIRPYTKNVLLRFEAQGLKGAVVKEQVEAFLQELEGRFGARTTLYKLNKKQAEVECVLSDQIVKARGEIKIVNDLLTRGVHDVIDRDVVEAKLLSGHKFRVKHGVDPTTSDLHLGYAVNYEKLRKLQELGHTIVFLIGSFTGRFGDPTDKNDMRQMRDKESVEEKAQNYLDQLGRILDMDKVEVRYNGSWYDEMSAEDLLKIMSEFSVAQMLERDMFEKRMQDGKRIGLHEIVYPMLQGYDSVELQSDLTVIGTDQTFNELQARPLQTRRGQEPQNLISMRMLVGLDGTEKMSQSLGNYVAFNDTPEDMYGKIMSIPDHVILEYFEMVTRVPMPEIMEVKAELKAGKNPRDFKMRLAREVVEIYHGKTAVSGAEQHFVQIFQKGENPEEMELLSVKQAKVNIVDLVVECKMANSKSDARRLVEQGGVRIGDEKIEDIETEIDLSSERVLRVGKRQFKRIVYVETAA